MNYQNILSEDVRTVLDTAAEKIATINIELWDEATHYIVEQLKDEASKRRNHFIFGMKYIADVKEHISACEENSAYRIVRQSN